MPEGDTIHRVADAIRPALLGQVPAIDAQPRLHRWAERLDGRTVTEVAAHGKHLFVAFDDLSIHSHLRMTGAWRVWPAPHAVPHAAWLVLRTPGHVVAQLRGPVLELLTTARRRTLVSALGPDVLGSELDEVRVLRRLRADDPTRGIGDALLDQRTVAGIGNIWKAEGCWAAGVDPWRPAGDVPDETVRALLRATRELMQASVAGVRPAHRVYRREGRPCPRCGAPIGVRGQGDDNRATYWCAGCQS